MESTLAIPQTPCASQGIESLLGKALLTAHLLTGSAEQAQSATMEALNAWHPYLETEADLWTKVLQAAAKEPIPATSSPSNHADPALSRLPTELLAVLKLEPVVRRCFVLRILVGLSAEACAALLQLRAQRVNQYTCAGLEALSGSKRIH